MSLDTTHGVRRGPRRRGLARRRGAPGRRRGRRRAPPPRRAHPVRDQQRRPDDRRAARSALAAIGIDATERELATSAPGRRLAPARRGQRPTSSGRPGSSRRSRRRAASCERRRRARRGRRGTHADASTTRRATAPRRPRPGRRDGSSRRTSTRRCPAPGGPATGCRGDRRGDRDGRRASSRRSPGKPSAAMARARRRRGPSRRGDRRPRPRPTARSPLRSACPFALVASEVDEPVAVGAVVPRRCSTRSSRCTHDTLDAPAAVASARDAGAAPTAGRGARRATARAGPRRGAPVIVRGRVLVDGAPALVAARAVATGEPVTLVDVPRASSDAAATSSTRRSTASTSTSSGRRALDVGASTGGFTDCLLQHGAARVLAVDVGRAQLHERLLADERVVSLERTNVRDLAAARSCAALGGCPSVVTVDLSFTSLVPHAARLRRARGAATRACVVLVKPQFEVDHVRPPRAAASSPTPRCGARRSGRARQRSSGRSGHHGRHGLVRSSAPRATSSSSCAPRRGATARPSPTGVRVDRREPPSVRQWWTRERGPARRARLAR